MNKKVYVSPTIQVHDCEMGNGLMAGSDELNIHRSWRSGENDPSVDILEEDNTLGSEITG